VTQGDDRRIKIIHPETGAVIEEMWSGKNLYGNIKLSTDGSRIFLPIPPSTLIWEPASLKPE
jgi:hypothetical protein